MTHITTAEAALERLEEFNTVDFFLCDYRLPGALTGLDFLQAIQKRFGRIDNAALLTGDTSSHFIEMVSASGWPVLFKPIQPARLRQLLARFAGKRPDGMPS